MIIIAALAALVAAPKTAAAPNPAKVHEQCIDSTRTNPEWAECGVKYLQTLEILLNRTWKETLSAMVEKAEREDLVREQRAWLKYRDVSCQYFAEPSAGREVQVLHYYLCRAAVVQGRINDLKLAADPYGVESQ